MHSSYLRMLQFPGKHKCDELAKAEQRLRTLAIVASNFASISGLRRLQTY